jgi:hypothetical protein
VNEKGERVMPNVCVYCGAGGNLTKDHIPPKCLFANRPSNLITVPSCEPCNKGFSLDDEYFRLALTSRGDTGDHPEAQLVSERAVQRISRPQARGFLESVFNSLTTIELKTPAGLYLGDAPGFMADLGRLSRVARRVITGLYFHEFGERLPDTHEAVAWQESGLQRVGEATRAQLRQWCNFAQSAPEKTIGEDVFSYWYQPVPDEAHVSVWVLIFYKTVGFIGLTGAKDKLSAARATRHPPTH